MRILRDLPERGPRRPVRYEKNLAAMSLEVDEEWEALKEKLKDWIKYVPNEESACAADACGGGFAAPAGVEPPDVFHQAELCEEEDQEEDQEEDSA